MINVIHLSGLHDNYIMGEAASAASANPQFSQLKVTGKESQGLINYVKDSTSNALA